MAHTSFDRPVASSSAASFHSFDPKTCIGYLQNGELGRAWTYLKTGISSASEQGERIAQVIAACGNLRHVNVMHGAGSGQSLERIAAALPVTLARLRCFDEIDGEDSAGARGLADSLTRMTGLQVLGLQLSAGREVLPLIGAFPPSLQDLHLRGSTIGERGWRAVGERLSSLPALYSLDLSESDAGGHVEGLAASLSSSLVDLNLSGCRIGERGWRAVADHLPFLTALNALDLSGSDVGGYVEMVAAALPASLRMLNLANTGMDTVGTQAIAYTMLRLSMLTDLNLNGNSFDRVGLQAMATALASLDMTVLELSDCGIDAEGVSMIAEGVKDCTALTHLHLSDSWPSHGASKVPLLNARGTTSLESLVDRVGHMSDLQMLNISGDSIRVLSVGEIQDLLAQSTRPVTGSMVSHLPWKGDMVDALDSLMNGASPSKSLASLAHLDQTLFLQ